MRKWWKDRRTVWRNLRKTLRTRPGAAPKGGDSRSLQPLRRLLPFVRPYRWQVAGGRHCPAVLLGGHADGSGRPARADRPWLRQRRCRPDPALFPVSSGRGGGPRAGHGHPLLFRDLAGRAGDRRCAARRVRPCAEPDAGLLRDDAHRRGALAADGRHHPDPDRDRLQRLDRAPQCGDADRARWC